MFVSFAFQMTNSPRPFQNFFSSFAFCVNHAIQKGEYVTQKKNFVSNTICDRNTDRHLAFHADILREILHIPLTIPGLLKHVTETCCLQFCV